MNESRASKLICSLFSDYLAISLLLFLVTFPQIINVIFFMKFFRGRWKASLSYTVFCFTLATPPREYCFTASRTQHLATMAGSCHRGPLTRLIDHDLHITSCVHYRIKIQSTSLQGFCLPATILCFWLYVILYARTVETVQFIVVAEWEKVALVGVWEMLILLWEITKRL